MNQLVIERVEELPEELEKKMTTSFIAQEKANGIEINFSSFSLILRKDECVIGVLNAFTWYAEVYVDDMWVDDAYRGQGYGRNLLENLENLFKGKGYNNINLVTSAFQALNFYKKCGFEVEFVRKNKSNPKLDKTFFIKYF